MKLAIIYNAARPETTGGCLQRAARGLGLSCDHWPLGELSRIPSGYDLYVRVDHGDDYDVPWPTHLRPAVFYAIDTHLRHSWPKIQRAAPEYDLVCCCHRDGARGLGAGGEWLPVACEPERYGAAGGTRDLDVAFVGTEGGVPRKFYLQGLRERYPNSAIGGADYAEMGPRYGRAAIGFNYSISNDVNMRVFEVLAAGALLVMNGLPHDDLLQLGLKEGTHYAAYHGARELFPLIDRYLARPDERRRIAEAGQAVVLRSHTYRHRVQQLLAIVERRLGVKIEAEPARGSPAPARRVGPGKFGATPDPPRPSNLEPRASNLS